MTGSKKKLVFLLGYDLHQISVYCQMTISIKKKKKIVLLPGYDLHQISVYCMTFIKYQSIVVPFNGKRFLFPRSIR